MSVTSEPSPGPSGHLIITLAPLLTQGAAALAPEPALGIAKVLWVKAGFRWHNAFNESTVRKADDLFACSVQDGGDDDPVPKGAELTEVTLEFYLGGVSDAHWVELTPQSLVFQYAEDRERVLEFLKRRKIVCNSSTR